MEDEEDEEDEDDEDVGDVDSKKINQKQFLNTFFLSSHINEYLTATNRNLPP
jgi:hypothetical protein